MTTTPTLWAEEAIISSFSTDANPQVLARSDNSFDIAWERGGQDIVGRHFTETGNFSGGDFLAVLSAQATNQIGGPRLIQQADGRVLVNYTQQIAPGDRGIERHLVNERDPDGNSLTLEQTGLDEVLLDSAAMAGGGTAHAFFFGGGTASVGLALRFTDADGIHSSGRIFVGFHAGQTQQNAAITALRSNSVAVAYENVETATSAREVRLHVYTASGTDRFGELTASAPGANAGFPDVMELRDGSFVVAWQQGGGLAFRQYTADGVATRGTPSLISSPSQCFVPKITALNDGGFIVAWTAIDGTEGDGSPELDIYLQRFDARGNTIGGRVHLDDPGDQGLFALSVATLDDGRVVVTYSSETGDATNATTLNYRIFDPREATIIGTEGDDNIVGREDASNIQGLGGNDRLTGRQAADVLNGGAGDDVLDGGGGNDVLNGGLNADTLVGRQGNDSYVVDNLLDVVTEVANEGSDSVRTSLAAYALGANVENLSFSAGGNFAGTGNALANTITGGGGNDVLDGGAGNDVLVGGFGDDFYVVDSLSDIVTELAGQGSDRIRTSLSTYSLASKANVEALSYTGTASFTGTGNTLDNVITGGAAADVLNGGGGNDTLNGFAGSDRLVGGTGNDVFVVDSATDIVTELAGQGTDTILTQLNGFSLAPRANVENLTFIGVGNVAGTGNGLANVITGGAGADTLKGDAGNDRLDGASGADRLEGGSGTDTLVGGVGKDTLLGGTGNDVFDFNTPGESAVGGGRDVIADFLRGDRIDLRDLDAAAGAAGNQAFAFIGGAAFNGTAGQLHYTRATGALIVEGDVNGDRVADFQIEVRSGLPSIVAGDFFL